MQFRCDKPTCILPPIVLFSKNGIWVRLRSLFSADRKYNALSGLQDHESINETDVHEGKEKYLHIRTGAK